jgi:hypothetical protein
MTRFLETTRYLPWSDLTTLQKYLNLYSCHYKRERSPTCVVRGWVVGPGLSTESENERERQIRAYIHESGISYPEYKI